MEASAVKISIALDGPAGSGKSTVAKLVARRFGYIYIDTGAMYRAVTLKALKHQIDLGHDMKLTELAENTDIVLDYDYQGVDPVLQVFLDGINVSDEIRTLEVTNNVSVVAAVAGVREALVALQQDMAKKGGVVMDGRDIGTVVLPKAELKVFLVASVEERSRRRQAELKIKGIDVDLAEMISQIEKRDYIDSHREVNPLRQADDAILLDTTAFNIEQVVEQIVALAISRGA